MKAGRACDRFAKATLELNVSMPGMGAPIPPGFGAGTDYRPFKSTFETGIVVLVLAVGPSILAVGWMAERSIDRVVDSPAGIPAKLNASSGGMPNGTRG
jgi:ABC-type uncharacterized transport system permease subunit